MQRAVKTPLTQALAEGKISREELKTLMRRSNWPAFWRLLLWLILICITGTLVHLSFDTLLIWPAMFAHGIVLVHHFSLQHECVHYTVFRTRWLNDLVGNICGLIIMLPHQHFRYEHCDHHTFTQLDGQDPELVEMPKNFGEYFYYLTALAYWKTKFIELFRHAAGRISEQERRFVPKSAETTLFWEARLMMLFYAGLLCVMVWADWWAPLWFWFIPLVLSEPVMRFIRMTEHVGRPKVEQMADNTRTNYVSWPWRFLCWNMNYHAEHHYAASVPFHALPKLHSKIKDHIYVEPDGYWGAHRDILQQIRRQGAAAFWSKGGSG